MAGISRAGTIQDMKTRLDTNNSELMIAKEQAERGSRAKSEFLANMSKIESKKFEISQSIYLLGKRY